MPNPFTLSALGASLVLGAVFGVQLGESTIGLINPIHFQGPAAHPRERGAALDPTSQPTQPSAPAYAQLYGWEQGYAARAADCRDCAALAARDAYAYSAEVPYFGGDQEPVRPVRVHRAAHEDLADEFVEAPPMDEPVLRYAHYPVVQDEGRWADERGRRREERRWSRERREARWAAAAERRWEERDDRRWEDDRRRDDGDESAYRPYAE